jgi:hypothetical protein
MINLQEYWAQVRAMRQKLPPVVFLASVAGARASGAVIDGRVSEVTRETAARRLADGTHRIATEQEINEFYDVQEANLNESELFERRRALRFTKLVEDDERPKAPSRPTA